MESPTVMLSWLRQHLQIPTLGKLGREGDWQFRPCIRSDIHVVSSSYSQMLVKDLNFTLVHHYSVRLVVAGGWWLVLICCKRKVLLTGCWLLADVDLVREEKKLLAGWLT